MWVKELKGKKDEGGRGDGEKLLLSEKDEKCRFLLFLLLMMMMI
jgi:hypothetical protein